MKFLYLILFSIIYTNLYSQFPAPISFQFSYDYIMLDEWGFCAGESINGPEYCSYFSWTPPDTSSTDATLNYYLIYHDYNPVVSVTDTFYTTTGGFIGELWVTAVYTNPDGESEFSNIVVNNNLPISIEEAELDEKPKIIYNKKNNQLLIDNINNIKLLRIYDIKGIEIYSKICISSTFNMVNLNNGLYIIEIVNNNNRVQRQKILIH